MDLTDISGTFDTLLKASPPIGLALFINFVLLFVGRIPALQANKDWTLPLVALAMGGFIYPFFASNGTVDPNIEYPLFSLFIRGVCIGGLSVAVHTVFKAKVKKWTGMPTGDTMIITKDEVSK